MPCSLPPRCPASGRESGGEKPIYDVIRAFAQAYNAADAKAVAELFVDGASVFDPSGAETQGKTAIAEMYTTFVPGDPGP